MKQFTELPPTPTTVDFEGTYYEANEKHVLITRNDEERKIEASYPLLEEAVPGLQPDIYEFFIDNYPEKAMDDDYEILLCLSALGQKLEQQKAPVVLINEHKPPRFNEHFWAVSFGFAVGAQFKVAEEYLVGHGTIRPKLFAPQTLLYYDDIGVEFTQSLPVSRWDIQAVNHIGAFLLQRKTATIPYQEDGYVLDVYDYAGDLYVGNAEIEEFISENPKFAKVIDGCRETYRNKGRNPEIGRSIARYFNQDLPDEVAKTLQWM